MSETVLVVSEEHDWPAMYISLIMIKCVLTCLPLLYQFSVFGRIVVQLLLLGNSFSFSDFFSWTTKNDLSGEYILTSQLCPIIASSSSFV